jgi:4-oxalocrotonate tautomerase
MPIMTIHLMADRYADPTLASLMRRCAAHYAEVLRSPMERIRVAVVEHRPETFFVDGATGAEGADDAPHFDYVVLAGRPQQEIEELMTGFTDIVEDELGVPRARIRGACRPVAPEHWGIGGEMASVKRAAEVTARAEAAPASSPP